MLRNLNDLGVLLRRDIGRTALYELSTTNLSALAIRELADVRKTLLVHMKRLASVHLAPRGADWVAVFGPLAYGDGDSESDIDIVVVRSAASALKRGWPLAISDFSRAIEALAGNPASVIESEPDDLDQFKPFVAHNPFWIHAIFGARCQNEQR